MHIFLNGLDLKSGMQQIFKLYGNSKKLVLRSWHLSLHAKWKRICTLLMMWLKIGSSNPIVFVQCTENKDFNHCTTWEWSITSVSLPNDPVLLRCGLHCDPDSPVCRLLLQCHHCLVPPLPVLLHDQRAPMAQMWQHLEQSKLHWSQSHQRIRPWQWNFLRQVQDHSSGGVLWVSDFQQSFIRLSLVFLPWHGTLLIKCHNAVILHAWMDLPIA